ncbi:MAG: hypothetical protein ABJP66_06610 [Hyphomicrobiales bacterium]|uniref:hypothetical protein n=1 Tax=Shimia thalassica TaxID=1715693 RepID=UPI003299D698
MAKIRLTMDNDNDYILIEAEVGAFGWGAELKFRVVNHRARRGQSQLPAPDVLDLSEDEYEEVETSDDDSDELDQE